jgi:hypothetical protein
VTATSVPEAARVDSAAADKNVKNIASTFAPRASGNTGKNPAVKGSVLYDIFTYQAWVCMGLGGLLSFNILFPSDQPDIWRLMGCVFSCSCQCHANRYAISANCVQHSARAGVGRSGPLNKSGT